MAFSSPYKSLKTIMVTIFRKDENNYANKTYVSTRSIPICDGGRYQFTINGVLTMSKPVESAAEERNKKAFHAYGSLEHMGIVD
jgi:hypothetical protein